MTSKAKYNLVVLAGLFVATVAIIGMATSALAPVLGGLVVLLGSILIVVPAAMRLQRVRQERRPPPG